MVTLLLLSWAAFVFVSVAHADTDFSFPRKASARPAFIVDEVGQHLFGNIPGKVEVTNFPSTSSQANYEIYTVVEHGSWGPGDSHIIPTAGWREIHLYVQGLDCDSNNEAHWRIDGIDAGLVGGFAQGSNIYSEIVKGPELHIVTYPSTCNSVDVTIKAYLTR